MIKPDVGTEVRVQRGPYDDSPWVNATVIELLSVQFRAITEGGAIVFGLFNGEGGSWKLGW